MLLETVARLSTVRVMAVQLQRVLISDSVDASCRSILEEGGVSVDYRPGLGKQDLLACIKVTFVCGV